MKPRNRLFLFAGVGVASCIGMAQLFRRQVSKQIHESEIFQAAFDMLNRHKGALYLLGQPIQTYSLASYSSPGMSFTDHSGIKVRVKGPKSNGVLFVTSKPDKEEKMQIHTVQLQVGRDSTKRLVIKKAPEEKSSAT